MKKSNYRLVVFVGDTDDTVSTCAQVYDPTSFLLDNNNYKEFFQNELTRDTTVYTSLGDLPKDLEIMHDLMSAADEVYYAPPYYWSDGNTVDSCDPTKSTQGLTENFLLNFCKDKKIHNFDLTTLVPDPVDLVDQRKVDTPQLWVVGDSLSYGTGIEPHQRYGHHVSNALSMPCSYLARPGSSIEWAADQILRSDIRANDTVVWGITRANRLSFIHNNKLIIVYGGLYRADKNLQSIIPEKLLDQENLFYKQMYAVKQVLNFCNKVGAKLLLCGFITSDNTLRYMSQFPNYCHYRHPVKYDHEENFLHKAYADLGFDFRHPGPKQHQLYADFVLEHL